MKILIAAIGKLKAGPELELFTHYTKRLPWKVSVQELTVKKQLPDAERKLAEGELLLSVIKDSEQVIALDEHGKDWTSQQFAGHLRGLQDKGTASLAFVIGGADGLSGPVQKRANMSLSFGRMTWPHMMVRMLLAEQLYRAQSILSGHPYHRE